MDPHVIIEGDGRSGIVRYREASGELRFHWEFGGGDVTAIVQTGHAGMWEQHPWTAGRRPAILRFVADELIRQMAPQCRAEIDEHTGDILLRSSGAAPPPPVPRDVAFVKRFSSLKARLGIGALVVALGVGGIFWGMKKVFMIAPGKGTPAGLAVRTDAHIATLIQTLEPYVPSLHRDHSKDTYGISLFIVPLDGAEPRLVPIKGGLSPNTYSLAKVLGSDGRAIWFDVAGTGAVDLRTFDLLAPAELRDPPEPKPTSALPLGPRIEHHLAAGLFIGPHTWLGMHSAMEAERDLKPRSWLKRVVRAESAKQERRFHRATLDPDTSDGHHRIATVTPLGDATYLNAAFLRMDDMSEPIRLADPPGVLMLYTSDPGLRSTAMIARVDTAGHIVWTCDTGVDCFTLLQVLPGAASTALVGTRPPVPGKLSEPLLVIVDHASGRQRTVSLWL